MFFGIFSWLDSPFIPFGLTLIGYFLCFLAWYNHSYLKNVGTSLSVILLLACLYLFSVFPEFGSSGLLMVICIVVVISIWRVEIKEVIITTIDRTGKAINAFFGAVMDTVHKTILAVMSFLNYVWFCRIKILKAIGTMLGGCLDIVGTLLLYLAWYDYSNPNIEIAIELFGQPLVVMWFIPVLMIVVGAILLYWIWFHQINNFLKTSYDAVIKAAGALFGILSKVASQLFDWASTIFDSGFIIAIVVLSFSAIGYGFVLILSGLIDPTGLWTEYLHSIPIFGDLLWFIAAIFQGQSDVDNVTSLLGIWDLEHLGNDILMARLIQILLGVIFAIFGIILSVVTFFTRDSMKLSSLRDRFLGPSKKQVIFEGKESEE
jgi:hypothetical protein